MDDVERLREFMARVYAWLSASYGDAATGIVDSPWPPIRVLPQLQELGAAAWREYERDHPLDALQDRISDLPYDSLVRYGICASQLTYKLATIEFAASRAVLGISGWIRKLLELIDSLLESILKALGIDDALKEIKDALLASLPEDE
jgi:hypothetical protein